MLKRFLVFAGETFYPTGGWSDFVGSFETMEESRAAAPIDADLSVREYGWRDIVDMETGETVEFFGNAYGRDMKDYDW